MVFISSCSDSIDEEGNLDDFTKDSGSFIDERDNQEYKWVKIGDQIWMAENLAFMPSIRSIHDGSSNTEARYFVYDYEGSSVAEAKVTENFISYGVLYNWSAAIAAVPKGWHLPSESEWVELKKFISDLEGNDSEVGKFLKSKSSWEENGNGIDEYGFAGKPGGINYGHTFGEIGLSGSWWSTTQYGNYAFVCQLWSGDNNFSNNHLPIDFGFSIRCIKD